MALIGFKNTHNQPVYVNPAQVAYVTTFEEGVTIITLAVADTDGKPIVLYVRGHADAVQQKLNAAT